MNNKLITLRIYGITTMVLAGLAIYSMFSNLTAAFILLVLSFVSLSTTAYYRFRVVYPSDGRLF